jgi:cytochrome P450
MAGAAELDRERIRELFDLRRRGDARGATLEPFVYSDDPYPMLQRLRETGPVHEGIVHELIGFDKPAFFQGLPEPDRAHFSVFDFATCDRVFRDEEIFRSSGQEVRGAEGGSMGNSMLYMNGPQHRRYRSLVQPSFVPKKAEWWITNWIHSTVNALIDGFEADGRAELNVDFDAAIPVLTITGSFGFAVEDALDIRSALGIGGQGVDTLASYLYPVIEARHVAPADDLISVLCQAEIADEDGQRHRLSDDEIFSFSHLLLAAGSGTTWKQLGITLYALLTHPHLLEAVREDRSLLKAAIEESLRWCPTDPMFSRYAARDVELGGVDIPAGAVVHLSLGAANRDPARYDRPDEYDPLRPLIPGIGFGGGPHVCLGQHVARAEMSVAIDALLERLPNLRLDPEAEAPQLIGMYERGPTQLPVVWG